MIIKQGDKLYSYHDARHSGKLREHTVEKDSKNRLFLDFKRGKGFIFDNEGYVDVRLHDYIDKPQKQPKNACILLQDDTLKGDKELLHWYQEKTYVGKRTAIKSASEYIKEQLSGIREELEEARNEVDSLVQDEKKCIQRLSKLASLLAEPKEIIHGD